MKDGQEGTVAEIIGGGGLVERLTSMGIRPGKSIKRLCGMFLNGPITICMDNTQLALGRGIASKILVVPVEAGNEKSCQ